VKKPSPRTETDASRAGNVLSTVRQMHATRGRARQFWRVFDRSLVPMVVVDNDRRYLAANTAARLVLRLTITELRKRQIDDLTPPERRGTLHDRWIELMRTGTVTGPYDVGLPDGGQLSIVYCALANILPGQHLIVFAPADWPDDELVDVEVQAGEPARGPLSSREREVLVLVAGGYELKDIAAELTISVPTVRTHLRNALRKLGARNRAHAIALAMQEGAIDLPPGRIDSRPTSPENPPPPAGSAPPSSV
jgi:DNA-binding CsgD family transcriptional regulator